MITVLGTSIDVYIAITVVIGGGAGWLMGQALAGTWRPIWLLLPYTLLLGFSARFLIYALFDGTFASATGYVIDTAVIGLFALSAFAVTRRRKMRVQYPWLHGAETRRGGETRPGGER